VIGRRVDALPSPLDAKPRIPATVAPPKVRSISPGTFGEGSPPEQTAFPSLVDSAELLRYHTIVYC
jgi:hypothetical protein